MKYNISLGRQKDKMIEICQNRNVEWIITAGVYWANQEKKYETFGKTKLTTTESGILSNELSKLVEKSR